MSLDSDVDTTEDSTSLRQRPLITSHTLMLPLDGTSLANCHYCGLWSECLREYVFMNDYADTPSKRSKNESFNTPTFDTSYSYSDLA